MAAPVDYTGQRAGLSVAGTFAQRRDPIVADRDFDEDAPGAAEVAGAIFMQDTLFGAFADEVREQFDGRLGEGHDAFFNPFSYFKEVRDDYQDMAFWLENGHFDDVGSPDQWVAKAEAIRRELGRRDTIARGGALGHIAGTILSFADVTTLVPIIGPVAKGGAAAKAGLFAANAAGLVGAQELAIHQMQDTRTWDETLAILGTGTALGGGLGVFSHILSKGHILNPRNPNNPLNLDIEIPHETSIGAAAARRDVDWAEGTGLGVLDKIGYWIKTPAAVARRTSDNDARVVMQDLADIGITSKQNEAGIATPESAEAILNAEYETKYLVTQHKIDKLWREANAEAGSRASASGLSLREDLGALTGRSMNVVPEDDFSEAVFRKMVVEGYTHADPIIDKYATAAAGEARKLLDHMFDRGVTFGLFREDQRLDNYLVQRWVSHKIAENPARFKELLYDLWSKGPDEEWLMDNFGITRKQFDALDDVTKAPKDGGSPTVSKRDILEDWEDERAILDLRRAEAAAEAAAERLENAKMEFRIEARIARREEKEAIRGELKEARATVKAAEAEYNVARERLEQLRLEHKALVEAAEAARTRTLDRQLELTFDGLPPKSPKRTPEAAESAMKAKVIADELRHQEAKVAKLERRLERLNAKAEAVQSAADEVRAKRANALRRAKEADLELRAARQAAKKASRKLKAAEKRKSLPEVIDELTRVLSDHSKIPLGILSQDVVPGTARVLHRGIKLDAETAERMLEEGFLDGNITNLLYGYTRDVGARLALREKFGSEDLAEQIARVASNYEKRIEASTSDRERAKLAAEKKAVIDTIGVLRDRVLGRFGMPDDPETAALYLGRMLRMVSYNSRMGGVMLSSITDLATISLQVGLGRHLRTAIGKNILKHAEGLSDLETRVIAFVAENSLLFARMAKNMGIDDLVMRYGFGSGATRRVSARAEAAMRWASRRMNLLNGMAWWNTRLKYVTAQIQLQNMIDAARKLNLGQAVDEKLMRDFARFGLDADDVRRLGRIIEEKGEINEGGFIDPNGGAWTDTAAGRALHRKMLIALKRATDEAVITPGFADTPPFMSKPMGKILLQFQSFGFAAVNKYVRHLGYGLRKGDMDALMSTTWALAMGATAYTVKEGVVKGHELSDKPGTWVYEAVDRSGLATFLMPYMNASFKLAAPALSEIGLDWFDMPSRYRQHSWLVGLLGPSWGVMEDIQKFGTTAFSGDPGRIVERGKRLVPFSNLWYLDTLWRRANGVE